MCVRGSVIYRFPGGFSRCCSLRNEWVKILPDLGHFQQPAKDALDQWFSGEGNTSEVREDGCYGTCYYGIFARKP
jgi:hypothetical protein